MLVSKEEEANMSIQQNQWPQDRSDRFEQALEEWASQGYSEAGEFLGQYQQLPTLDAKREAASYWLIKVQYTATIDPTTGTDPLHREALKRAVAEWHFTEKV